METTSNRHRMLLYVVVVEAADGEEEGVVHILNNGTHIIHTSTPTTPVAGVVAMRRGVGACTILKIHGPTCRPPLPPPPNPSRCTNNRVCHTDTSPHTCAGVHRWWKNSMLAYSWCCGMDDI